jgi:hypothetical protein
MTTAAAIDRLVHHAVSVLLTIVGQFCPVNHC